MNTTTLHCPNCNAPLGERGPVVVWYRESEGGPVGGVGYRQVRGCAACMDEGYHAERRRRGLTIRAFLRHLTREEPHVRETECYGCMRPVFVITDTKHTTPYTRPIYCSKECRDAPVAVLKRCESCGKRFTPTRSDAKTCSSACRQRAYRARRAAASIHELPRI
jgi:hypothetical protein